MACLASLGTCCKRFKFSLVSILTRILRRSLSLTFCSSVSSQRFGHCLELALEVDRDSGDLDLAKAEGDLDLEPRPNVVDWSGDFKVFLLTSDMGILSLASRT